MSSIAFPWLVNSPLSLPSDLLMMHWRRVAQSFLDNSCCPANQFEVSEVTASSSILCCGSVKLLEDEGVRDAPSIGMGSSMVVI